MGRARVCAVLLLLATVCWHEAQARHLRHRSLARPRRDTHYCGGHLVEILTLVCGRAGIVEVNGKRATTGGRASFHVDDYGRRRSQPDYLPAHSRKRRAPSAGQPAGPLRRPPLAALSSSAAARVRVKRSGGIVQECCVNACSLTDLKRYCNDA